MEKVESFFLLILLICHQDFGWGFVQIETCINVCYSDVKDTGSAMLQKYIALLMVAGFCHIATAATDANVATVNYAIIIASASC